MSSLLLAVLVAMTWATPAAAQRLNRCTDAAGQRVYTDRPCESLGAHAQRPAPVTDAAASDRNRLGARCPRRLSELVDALRGAILDHDVNRLSSLYLWGSTSDAAARRILDQLDAIARRPLLAIAPLYPPPLPAPAGPTPASDVPPAPERPRPVALRLDQVLSGTAAPARSVMELRWQQGCFRVTLPAAR